MLNALKHSQFLSAHGNGTKDAVKATICARTKSHRRCIIRRWTALPGLRAGRDCRVKENDWQPCAPHLQQRLPSGKISFAVFPWYPWWSGERRWQRKQATEKGLVPLWLHFAGCHVRLCWSRAHRLCLYNQGRILAVVYSCHNGCSMPSIVFFPIIFISVLCHFHLR